MHASAGLPDEALASQSRTLLSVMGLSAAIVVNALPPFLVGALAPQISLSISFTTRDLGIAMASFYAFAGFLSPLGGRFVARFGSIFSLKIACVAVAAGMLGISLATNAWMLIGLLGYTGLVNAVLQPAVNPVLATIPHERARALAFGVVQASIPAATMVAAVLLSVASYWTSWQVTVALMAVVALATPLVVPRQDFSPMPPVEAEAPLAPPTSLKTPEVTGSEPVDVDGMRAGDTPITESPTLNPSSQRDTSPKGPPILALLIATGFLASIAVTSLPSFVASTGTALAIAPWLIGAAQAIGGLGSVFTRIVVPGLASHQSLRFQLGVIALLQMVGVVSLAALGRNRAEFFVIGTIAAFGLGWGFNGLYNLVVVNAFPTAIVAMTGWTQGGIFLGAMTGPIVFSEIVNIGGFGTAWDVMAVVMLLAVAATVVAALRSPTTRRSEAVNPPGNRISLDEPNSPDRS